LPSTSRKTKFLISDIRVISQNMLLETDYFESIYNFSYNVVNSYWFTPLVDSVGLPGYSSQLL